MTPRGELVLRRDGEHFEVISNGVFLMDTRNGESERALIRAALERLSSGPSSEHENPEGGGSLQQSPIASPAWRVLVGGLGVGFSLVEALSDSRVGHVTVAEIESSIVEWHGKHLAHITGAALGDRRTEVLVVDIADLLRGSDQTYDLICLDVDNGPDWTVTDANAGLYGDEGTALLASRLRPGGVLTVWSAAGSAAYQQVLHRHFGNVEVMEIPVPRGEPDVVFAASRPVAQTHGRDSDSS